MQVDKVKELLIKGQTSGASYEEWVVSLLSSIAMSLAKIADEKSKEAEE